MTRGTDFVSVPRVKRLLALALALGLAAGAFRAVHLGTASIWWDELVHVHLATRPAAELLDAVKWGPIATPAGNVGAMPLDYVLLHAWARVAPAPAAPHLEAYWRFPSWLWSTLAVVVLALLLGTVAGPLAAVVGGGLMAFSVAAALYAAEARPYSLMTLLSAANLATFAAVARPRSTRRAWLGFVAVALAFVATGLPSAPMLAAEGAILLGLAVARDDSAAVAGVAATALAVALAAGLYLHGIDLHAGFARAKPADPRAVANTLSFLLAGEYGHPFTLLAAAAAVPLAVRHTARAAPRAAAVLAAAVASFVALPALLVAVRVKEYYFHVRHALFLLPPFVVVVTLGVLGAADLVARGSRTRRAVLAVGAALALAAPPAAAFLADPFRYFFWTKAIHDWKGLARRLEATSDEGILLVAENANRDHDRANYLGVWYLQAYHLTDRILFCSTWDLRTAARLIADAERAGTLRMLDRGCTAVLDLQKPTLYVDFRTHLGALGDPRTLPPPPAPRVPAAGGRPPIRHWMLLAFDARTSVPGLRAEPRPGFVLLDAPAPLARGDRR